MSGDDDADERRSRKSADGDIAPAPRLSQRQLRRLTPQDGTEHVADASDSGWDASASTNLSFAALAEELTSVPQDTSHTTTSLEADQSQDAAVLDLDPLTSRSLAALRSLIRYGKRHPRYNATLADWPNNRRAAVMVALFGGRSGELNVVLSTRSPAMRVNPGEVALPGGKMETSDLDLEYTARREAFEEIGLPMSRESVRHLCNLPPFLSRTSPLLVTPVVCLLLDASLKPNINPSEVANIFSHPLFSFLTNTPPAEHYVPYTVTHGTKPYRMQYDINWLKGKPYRLFRFEGRLSPIWGFTADILIHVAKIAFNREPEYERKAPGQLSRKDLVRLAVEQLNKGTLPERPTYPQKMLDDSQKDQEEKKSKL